MTNIEFEKKTKNLIDDLKSVCANYGLGNDGNEFKIITQIFLYKFLNDKFVYETKNLSKKLAESDDWLEEINRMPSDDFEILLMQLNPSTARLKPGHLIPSLFKRQNEPKFADLFDSTLLEIALNNSDVFSVVTSGGEKVVLFENISKYVIDNRDDFCKALVNKLIHFSFEHIFHEKFDFFATIFEYLIKDYNTNSGGKYAEYFTPHVVAKIMAACLVSGDVSNVSCYDPSAGSGTLLMNLAHEIGEDKCTIYSQDISQKSSNLLRLNLILNNLVHSIHNVIKGNTILDPFHRENNGSVKKFDFIVANPPFKLDFSDYRNDLDTSEGKSRFFAGIPPIPEKHKEKMAIYTLFLQHVISSLKEGGCGAIVVPSGFITAKNGVEFNIRKYLVENKVLGGAIIMPSNIFATTGTNVSIVFIDKSKKYNDVVLIDASKLGVKVKEGKNQRTILSDQERVNIVKTYRERLNVDNFSVIVDYEKLESKKFSLSAGQYFNVKFEYDDMDLEDFKKEIQEGINSYGTLIHQSALLDQEILKCLRSLVK